MQLVQRFQSEVNALLALKPAATAMAAAAAV